MMKKLVYMVFILGVLTGCDDIIEVEDISNKTVALLAPSNESVLNITDLTLSWQTVEEAEVYHLQIATPSFEAAQQIVKDTTVAATNFSTALTPNSYEWRVRAENSGYETSYTTQRFSIEE